MQLFTDFLCLRGPELDGQLPMYYKASHVWLQGMITAAADAGLEVQLCMACPHQALESLDWPAVTNARANGDGGMFVPQLTYPALLASSLGIGWSKVRVDALLQSQPYIDVCFWQDNLRLSVFSEGDTYIQALLAAISLGPVGLSDELEGYPSPPLPGAGVVTNVSLALSLVTSNGSLLGPSTAATPIDGHLRQTGGLGGTAGNVWVTYTAVADGAGATSLWFMAVGFSWAADAAPTHALTSADLAPIVDGDCPTPPDFADIPCGSFFGAGTTLSGDYVAWDPLSTAPPAPFGAGYPPFNLALAPHVAAVAHVAPVWPGGIALLGEQGKLVPLSAYRFASVASTGQGTLSVGLRGAPNEAVVLVYVLAPTFARQTVSVTLSSAGGAVVSLP